MNSLSNRKSNYGREPIETGEKKSGCALLKAVVIAAAVAVVAMFVCMLVHESRVSTASLLSNAWGNEAFAYEGDTYFTETTIKNYTKALQVLRRVDDEENYSFLPGEGALWSDTTERFVYRDGKKLKTCDINGKNAETLYRASGFRCFPVPLMIIDQYVVVKNAYRSNSTGIQSVGNFFLLDLTTESILNTTISAELGRGVTSLCIEDGYLYYSTGSISGGPSAYHDICRCSLETGECEVLTTNIPEAATQGCVIEGYLYFRIPEKGFYRIPTTGNEVEKLDAGGVGNWPLVKYDSKVLFAHTSQESNGTFGMQVTAYDPSGHTSEELFRWPMEDPDIIVNLRVQDDTVIVFCYNSAVYQGKLKQD